MCQSPMHDFLAGLPKVEHHMHIEGTIEPEAVFELARRNRVPLPSVEEDPAFASPATLKARYQHWTCLDDFLHYYYIGQSVFIMEADYEGLLWAYFERAKRDGVCHAEIFFDPQSHTSRGVKYETVVTGFAKAQERARQMLGISSELIVCMCRHLPVAHCENVYREALSDLEAGIVKGLGLDSTEIGYHPSLYKHIYADAEAKGIYRTAHAGEEADVSYMRSAIEDLHCQRVDHGIKLPDDPALMADFARRKILVTLCPLSNVALKCVKTVAEVPVQTFLDNGVPFSINSDDPAYFHSYIGENYCAVQNAFSLSHQQWRSIVTASIDGSWCSQERKGELQDLLSAYMAGF